MAEFHTYDSAADQNQQAVPNGLPRGTPGGFVYGVVRELAATCRRFHDDRSGRLKATGTNGNYVVASSRAIDLARGASIRFRANHQNPNAGPTLLGRPLTYADGSTIPAGGIKVDQLCDASWDNDNSRWALTVIPAATVTQGSTTVTGDKISLSGEAQGSVAIRAGTSWIASAAGSATQFFRGGPNPGFVSLPPGPALLACRIGASNSITNRAGLQHTATVTRLGVGSYRLGVTPPLPATAMPLALCNTYFRVVQVDIPDSSTVTVGVATTNDPSDAEDLTGGQAVNVVVF